MAPGARHLGAAVATLVHPVRPHREVRLTLAEMLRALAAYLTEAVVERRRATARTDLLGAARRLDRQLQEVRNLVRPITGATFLTLAPGLGALLRAASTVMFFARPLAADAQAPLGEPASGRLRAVGARLAASARALADTLANGSGRPLAPAVERSEEEGNAPDAAGRAAQDVASPVSTLEWLTHLDEALLLLDHVAREGRWPPEEPTSRRPSFLSLGLGLGLG